jgi:hypothetical protein
VHRGAHLLLLSRPCTARRLSSICSRYLALHQQTAKHAESAVMQQTGSRNWRATAARPPTGSRIFRQQAERRSTRGACLSKVITTTAARVPGAGGPVPTQGPSSLPAEQHKTCHHMQLQQGCLHAWRGAPLMTWLPAAHLAGRRLCLPLEERLPWQAAPPPRLAAGASAAPASHQSCCFAANRHTEGQAGPLKLTSLSSRYLSGAQPAGPGAR